MPESCPREPYTGPERRSVDQAALVFEKLPITISVSTLIAFGLFLLNTGMWRGNLEARVATTEQTLVEIKAALIRIDNKLDNHKLDNRWEYRRTNFQPRE